MSVEDLGYLRVSRLDDGKSLVAAGRRKFIVGAAPDVVLSSLQNPVDEGQSQFREHIFELLDQQHADNCARSPLPVDIRVAGTGVLADKLKSAFDSLRPIDGAGVWDTVTLFIVDRDIPATEFRSATESVLHPLPTIVRDGELQLGPLTLDEHDCSYQDLLDRRIAVSRHLLLEEAERQAGRVLSFHPPSFYENLLAAIATTLQFESGRWFESLRHGAIGIDLESLRANFHPLLRVPRGLKAGVLTASSRPLSHLIDSHNGLVSKLRVVRHDDSIPPNLVTVQADVSLTNRILPWANNGTCQGSAFDDQRSARDAAIGESVERYCANILDTLPRITGSWHQLVRSGVRALDPERLVLHSPSQYSSRGFPLVPFTRDLETDWVPGRSVSEDHEVWVPVSLTYVNYYIGIREDIPKTNLPSFPGIAAGRSQEFAVVSGIEEVVERHATMCWWHNATVLPRLRLTGALRKEVANGAAYGQQLSAIVLPNIFGVPVAAGIVRHDKAGLINIGFAARPRLEDAVKKAWTEAYTLQEGSRDLLRPDGAYRRAVARGEIDGTSMKPVRDDRRYLESYQDDFRDVNDLMCQQQIYLDPRAYEQVAHLIETPESDQAEVHLPLTDRSLGTYRKVIEARGYEIIIVDLTTEDVAACGMSVVRVIIPGLVPNFPAGFPHLGKMHLQHDPVELGLRSSPLAENQLNYFPLPHA